MKEIEGGHSSGCCLTCRLSAEASLMIRERWIIFDSWASWKEGKKTDCISKIKMKLFFKAVFFSTKLIFYIIRSIINITYQNCHQQKKTLLFQVHHRWNPEKSSSTNSELRQKCVYMGNFDLIGDVILTGYTRSRFRFYQYHHPAPMFYTNINVQKHG